MAKRTSESKVRKLALPLTLNLGNDGIVSDGFFELNSKNVSKVIITSIDEEGYATCELFQPLPKQNSLTIENAVRESELLGIELSKTKGRGSDKGEYRYFERSDGHIYAEILGGARKRRIHLGSLIDRTSKISIVLREIAKHFQVGKQFDRKDLIILLPKHLTYGQILKAILGVLKIKGYLETHEKRYKGRLYERYSATDKIHEDLESLKIQRWLSSE